MSKELIRLDNCTMAFDNEIVLDNINLYINDKEFLTLLGPSGCGKTTTLRIIGGFQTPTSGDVLFDGVRMNSVPPHKRAINTVFQKYALFPHLNVYENIAFGLRIPKADASGKKVKLSEKEIHSRVMEMLEIVNLRGFEKRHITALSGGLSGLGGCFQKRHGNLTKGWGKTLRAPDTIKPEESETYSKNAGLGGPDRREYGANVTE